MKDMVHYPGYRRMKESGTIVEDIDRGIARYLKYFGKETDYGQLASAYQEKNIRTLLDDICAEFSARYQCEVDGVELNNCYQKGICVSAYTSQINRTACCQECSLCSF